MENEYVTRRSVKHSDNHFDIEELRTDEDGNQVWAVRYCGTSPIGETMNFKKVTLVTGHDDKGNENFFFDADGVWYNSNECEMTDEFMRYSVFPEVIIARFGDVELTGDQWRDLQCPIRMTQEQLGMALANQPAAVTAYEAEFVDAWSDKESVELSLPNSPWRISARKTITQCKEGWLDNFGFKYTDEKIAEMFDKWMNPQRSDIEKYVKIEQRGYNVR